MKKLFFTLMVFGFLADFTRAAWSPVQVAADGVGSTAKKTVDWLNA